MSYSRDFEHEGERLRVTAKSKGEDQYQVTVGDRVLELRATVLPDGRLGIEHEGQHFEAAASRTANNNLHVRLGSQTYLLTAHVATSSGMRADSGDGMILAPMTGTILKIDVTEGDEVSAGQTVAVLTAMKMEHKLLAGIDGTVMEILEQEGVTIDQGAVILRIEA